MIHFRFLHCHRHTEKTTRPIKLEIRPTFLVPDTNGFIDHLEILQKFAESKIFTIVIPIVGKIFHTNQFDYFLIFMVGGDGIMILKIDLNVFFLYGIISIVFFLKKRVATATNDVHSLFTL